MGNSATRRKVIGGKPRGNNRVPPELTIAREERIWELKARAHTVKEITAKVSAEFGVKLSERGVRIAIHRVAKQVSTKIDDHVDEWKAKQLAGLEALFEESMAAYRRTVGEQTEVTTRVETTADGVPRRAIIQKKHTLAGDPRLLGTALEALRDQRKLLGIDAPVKLDVTRDRPLEHMTDDELAAAIRQREAEETARVGRR